MKKAISRILVLALALGIASYMAAADEGSWTGYVTETHCGEKGAKEGHADCAIKCVKEKGAKWALYNPADKSVTVMTGDSATMEKMAGKKVTVKGNLDKAKKEIAVSSMTPAS
ncbi:MAG TPA: hypothetical protein VKE50_03740 [Thermoanaerobaculia bacterium]|nr:hypothetical protein [Thermoanaerobaculia bacterium]